jgi:TolB-like protein/Tfp pilus assembly protein PilF
MNSGEYHVYEFGRFRLDVRDRILFCGERTVHVTEKVFNILLLLAQRSGHLVTKEELMNEVWPDSVVEESNLTVSISALRKALDDGHDGSQYIETVSKRGYRFVAEVRELKGDRPGVSPKRESFLSRSHSPAAGPETTTLAVLPLINVSDDPSLEYLSDGITESLINSLSKLPQLKVLARSTMFRFKRTEIDPLDVGEKLATDALLTGRVLQIDQDLIVKLELLNIKEGSQIWGEQYKRRPADIFEVQEEISQEVSEKLKLRLTSEQKRQLNKRYTEDLEAYHLYLKGRYCWNKRTGEGLKMGIEFFQQAIAKDADYALAYAGLGDSYAIIPFYTNIPPKPAFQEAKKATDKALEIDDTLAEAHATLAYVKEYYEWDWAGAGEEYRKAIELNPNYATAHQWYGMYFMKLGQFERARRELKQALRFDPHSLIINADLGLPFLFKKQFDQGAERFLKILDIDQHFIWARFFLGWTYERGGKFIEAIEQFQKAKVIDDRPEVSAMIAHTYATSGRTEEARRILGALLEESKHHYISAYYMATIYAGLEDNENAFKWLEKACSDRNEWLVWLNVDSRFDCLSPDPRFAELLRRIGFSPEAIESHARDAHISFPPENASADRQFDLTHTLLGLAFLEKGRFEEAIAELEKTLALHRNNEASALLGYAYAASGRRDEALAILEELRTANAQYVDPAFFAIVYAGLKDTDHAFEYLEKAHAHRSRWLSVLSVSSLFDGLRADPRFKDLLQ